MASTSKQVRPALKGNTLPTKPLPKEKFGLAEDDENQVFDQMQKDIAKKLEGKLDKTDKKSTLDTIKLLKEELDTVAQELSDARELDHYHATQVRKLEEENARLTSIIEEFEGLSYLDKQEKLLKRNREVELEIEALQKSFLKIRGIYEKRLSNLRRKVAKEEHQQSRPMGSGLSAKKFSSRPTPSSS